MYYLFIYFFIQAGIWGELLCSISTVSIYYAPESKIRVKCYYHLNFSRAFPVHFQMSRNIMRLTHTPESKVMAVWISRELTYLISSVSIYYEPESEIRVKCYDHLNFSKASVVHFQASRHIMGLTHTPESKVIAFWICRELSCSITTVSIYNVQELTSEWNGMTIWISRELPWFIFELLDISWACHIHPSQKL